MSTHESRKAEAAASTGIRPYGPGKFDTILDAYVYSVSGDGGPDEQAGDSSDGPAWYGLMRNGRTIFRDHDPFLETLNADEQKQLTECAGVIICEASSGSVEVTYYATADQLQAAWDQIEAGYADDVDDDGDSDHAEED